jgi:hypothetical protein
VVPYIYPARDPARPFVAVIPHLTIDADAPAPDAVLLGRLHGAWRPDATFPFEVR